MVDEFADLFGGKTEPKKDVKPIQHKKEDLEEDVIYTDSDIEKLIEETKKQQENLESYYNCLVLGSDGTGKSGIVMTHLLKLPKPSIIIDLDGGNAPLYYSYYKDQDKDKKITIIDVIEIKPTSTDIELDYKKTINKVKAILKYVKVNSEKYSAIVIDGLSTLLKNCEYAMRIEKNMKADGDVSYRYWKLRNQIFTEILAMAKSISINKFYIAHEDFIIKGGPKEAMIKQNTNQMIHQRIICKKVENLDRVEFVAKIDKSKYDITLEGKEYVFASVNPETNKFTWMSEEIFRGLKGGEKK